MDFAGAFHDPSELSWQKMCSNTGGGSGQSFCIYLVAEGLDEVSDNRKTMPFQNVIGPASMDVYHTFECEATGDAKKLVEIKTFEA